MARNRTDSRPEEISRRQNDRLYAAMVRAVRAWIAAEHPFGEDRCDITLFDSVGCGDTIAQFHTHAESEYMLGDLRAMRTR